MPKRRAVTSPIGFLTERQKKTLVRRNLAINFSKLQGYNSKVK